MTCFSAVIIVTLVAGLASALPHWRGHNHHDWRSFPLRPQHEHGHNPEALVLADSLKDLFPQHHHRGWPHRSWPHHPPHHPWQHHSPHWGRDQTPDDQKTPQNQQPRLEWQHRSWHHHSPHWGRDQTPDDQKTPQNQQPLLEWPHHPWQHHSHSWSLDRTKDRGWGIPQIQEAFTGWPHQQHHHHGFNGRRHHWPHWSRWSQNTAENNKDKESQQPFTKTNNGEASKVTTTFESDVNHNKDNEKHKTLGEVERPTESHQSSERKESPTSNSDKVKSFYSEDNLALVLVTRCQTINTDGKNIKTHNEFCYWPEENAGNESGTVGTQTVCEIKAITPDVLMPDDDYFKSGQLKKRIECKELASDPKTNDHQISDHTNSMQTGTSAIEEKHKHKDSGFVNTNDTNNEGVKAQDDKMGAILNNAIKEIPAVNMNVNQAEEKQIDNDERYHVVLVQHAGETGLNTPQAVYEVPKEGRDSDDVIEPHSDNPKHKVLQDEHTRVIGDMIKEYVNPKREDVQEEKLPVTTSNGEVREDTDEPVKSHSNNLKHEDVQKEKPETTGNGGAITKGDTEENIEKTSKNGEIMEQDTGELVESHSGNPKHEDVQKEKPETTANDDAITKGDTEENIETTSNNDDIVEQDIDELVESHSDNPKYEDVEKDKPETTANTDEVMKDTESISDSIIRADLPEEKIPSNNDKVIEVSNVLVESHSDNPKHTNVPKEAPETSTKNNDVEKNTDDLIAIISVDEDHYIRDLFEIIEAS